MKPPSAPPLLVYTVLRLALFVAVLAVIALIGARGWLLLLLAAVVSLALSYVLLRGPRERLAEQVAERADPSRRRPGRVSKALDDDARAEDEAAEGIGDDRPPSDPRRP
ncbi:MAG TPA: DUF4229 domain-containing protein [Actinomycetales bacterium]|nr:DUF4229 domain-containing protein [Actinomycetales bacterium]